MSAEIIDFKSRHRTSVVAEGPHGSAYATANYKRLRSVRKAAWREADATTSYFRALLDSLALRMSLRGKA